MRIRVEKRLKVGGYLGVSPWGEHRWGDEGEKESGRTTQRENGMTVVYNGELKPALLTGK